MANPGAYPLDPDSDVGQFRLASGDVNSVPLDPPVAGQQSYTLWSDAEIEGYLAVYPDSPYRAVGAAYMALAAQAALSSISVADYDLKVDNTKRAEQLRLTGQWFFEQADIVDLEDGFFVGPTGARCDIIWPPELAPWDLSQFLCSRCVRPFCNCGV